MDEDLLGRLHLACRHHKVICTYISSDTQERIRTDELPEEKEIGVDDKRRGEKRERETERGERVRNRDI